MTKRGEPSNLQPKFAASPQGKWYLKNKDKAKERSLAHYHKTYLKKTYGLAQEEYEKMFTSQGGVCAICGVSPKKMRLCVDHDHATGRIRGLLCIECNKAVARLDVLPEWPERARRYLNHAVSCDM